MAEVDAFTLREMGDVDVVYGYDGHPNAGRDGAHGDFLKRCLLARRIILMTSASKEVVKNLGLPQDVQNEYDHHGLQNCKFGSSKVTIHLWVPKDYQPAGGSTESSSFLAKMRNSSQHYETPRPHPCGTSYYLNGLWDVYVAEDLPGEFNPTMRTYFVNKVTKWPETRLKLKKNTTYSEGVMYGWALSLKEGPQNEVRLLVIHSNHAVSLVRPGAYTTQTKAPKHGNVSVLDDEQVKALLVQPMDLPSRTSSRLASIARASAKVEDEDDSEEDTNATTSAEEDEIDKQAKVATRDRTKVREATKAATTTKHEKAKGGQPTQKQSTTKAIKPAEAAQCKTRSCTKEISRGSSHGCCADHGCSEPGCTRKQFSKAEGCTTCKIHTCTNPQCYKKRKGEGPRCGEHTCKLKGCSNPSPSSSTFCRRHVCSEPTCNNAKQTNSSQCRKHAFPRTALPTVKDVPVAPSSVTCTASQCNKKPRGGPRCAEHTCKLKGCSNASQGSFTCCEKHACSEPGCNSEKHAKSSLCKKHHFSETKKALLKELPKVGSGGIDHLQLGEPSLTRIFGHIDEATTKGMQNTNQVVNTARTASEKTAQSVLSHLSKKTKPALDEINDRTQNLPRVLEEIKTIAANSITQGSGNHDDIRGQIETARQEAKSANEEMMHLLEKATEQNSPGMTVGDHINLRQGESDMLVNILKQGVAPLMDSFAATHRESIRSVASVARARVEKRSRSRSRSTRHKRSTRSPNRRCHRTHSRNRYRYYSRSRSRSRHHSRSRSRSHRGHRGDPSRHDSRSRSRSSSFGRSRSRSHGRRREDRRRRPRGRRRH